jgi:hypothetical protein
MINVKTPNISIVTIKPLTGVDVGVDVVVSGKCRLLIQ